MTRFRTAPLLAGLLAAGLALALAGVFAVFFTLVRPQNQPPAAGLLGG